MNRISKFSLLGMDFSRRKSGVLVNVSTKISQMFWHCQIGNSETRKYTHRNLASEGQLKTSCNILHWTDSFSIASGCLLAPFTSMNLSLVISTPDHQVSFVTAQPKQSHKNINNVNFIVINFLPFIFFSSITGTGPPGQFSYIPSTWLFQKLTVWFG